MIRFKIFKIKLFRVILKILILFLIMFFIFKLVVIQKKNIKKEKELEEYNKKVEAQVKENAYLQNQIDVKMSDDYKEKYAREKLDMTKVGERIIYDVTKD